MPPRTLPNSQRIMGQYMTPDQIANQMCEQITRPPETWKVFDPACGDGNLLIAAANFMQQKGVTDIHKRIIGIDIDSNLTSIARQRLSNLLKCKEENIQVFNFDFYQILNDNFCENLALNNLDFNIIISNPPYGKLREYDFFELSCKVANPGTELIFLVPLAFIDKVIGVKYIPLKGRPMEVTTGHAIIHHISNHNFSYRCLKGLQSNHRFFKVLSGIKLYEIGSGIPAQTKETLNKKPYSSDTFKPGWLPCLRTGDIQPFSVNIGRLWVNYGNHLAHPKELDRFSGPRLFVRRVPVWNNKHLASVYLEETALCAGDVLVIKHNYNNQELLKGLSVYLNSPIAAKLIVESRPSLVYRQSFPKISAKDLNELIEHHLPSDDELLNLAKQYGKVLT